MLTRLNSLVCICCAGTDHTCHHTQSTVSTQFVRHPHSHMTFQVPNGKGLDVHVCVNSHIHTIDMLVFVDSLFIKGLSV